MVLQITLRDIEKRFGAQVVLRSVQLSFQSKSFTTLLGPSGCGKTTLLRMIAGLETPDNGEIYFDDHCVFSKQKGISLPPEKRGLGFVFQDFSLWPHLTVFENVAFGLRARKDVGQLCQRVTKALNAVRLEDFSARYPHALSGGQQQRVAFARAMAIEPQCILFDEPFSALDAVLREEMRAELKTLAAELGITAIFVTHDQAEALSLSDEIVLMRQGGIEQTGTPEEIYQQPATPFAARFIGRSNWIGQNRMFRPEALHFEKTEDAQAYPVHVASVRFVGGEYELCLTGEHGDWYARSARRIPEGELAVYIKNKDVFQLH